MTIQSRLNEINRIFEREPDPIPDSILAMPMPKNWNKVTAQEHQAILDCVKRTNEYVNGSLIPHLNEMEIGIQEMDQLGDALKDRHEAFIKEHTIIFSLGNGVKMAINSVGALFSKTNQVVMAVFFKTRTWADTMEDIKKPMVYVASAVGAVGLLIFTAYSFSASYFPSRNP